MDLQGDGFLARAALADHQDAGIGIGRDKIDPLPKLFHLNAVADQLTIPVAAIVAHDPLGIRTPRLLADALGKIPHRHCERFLVPIVAISIHRRADQLMERLPGESIYGGKTPAQRGAEKLVEEFRTLNDAATRREEWMAVQAIMTGAIPIVGIGVNETINFGLTNVKTLTGNNRWGQSAAKVLDNLDDWAREVLVSGFANVDMCIMGKTALRLFLADESVQKALDNRRVEMGLINPRDLPNGVRYIGHLNKPNVDIYEYAEVYLDDWTDPANPATNPLVPDNKIVLISSRADYMLGFGACTYIDDATQQWVTVESDRVLRSYIEHRPDRRMLELQAHPLPVPDKADSWLVATVCA